MVFAINPTADKTFDAFKTAAQASTPSGSASAAPSGSATSTGSTGAATTSPGAASGRASVGIGAVAAALLFGGMNAI
jgi:hypothetical protein